MISAEAQKIIDIGVKSLEDKKAEDIKVIDISEICSFADAMVIASGSNPNQLHAMTDDIEEKLHKEQISPMSYEGYDKANWILMDYRDVIFQIFDRENRKFYDLERLYSDGEVIE